MLYIPMTWNPSRLDVRDKDLLQYCIYVHFVLDNMILTSVPSPMCRFPVSDYL
jgi:hypothetical protein